MHETKFAMQPDYKAQEEDDWRHWQRVGDPVTHIELRRWADLLVIAPLSANTLAKLAHGMCDNLLTCIVRAWDYQDPLLVSQGLHICVTARAFWEFMCRERFSHCWQCGGAASATLCHLIAHSLVGISNSY